jgi:HD-GYP domain-containing protein (c-di-GMP phosphodiesterase class II)
VAETQRPRVDWSEVVEFLHVLFSSIVVRNQYPDRHPAIGHADEHVVRTFAPLASKASEIVVALIEGEFVVMERPMPELRRRVPGLAEAMQRLGIECLVFSAGLDRPDVAMLAQGLNAPAPSEGQESIVRERLQGRLKHVLLRFVEVRGFDASQQAAAQNAAQLEPSVRELLEKAEGWATKAQPFDLAAVRTVAEQILWCVRAKAYAVSQHSWAPGVDFHAGHATNVAVMAGAMANEAGLRTEAAVDVIAAGILHDIGHALLPAAIRHVPEPVLDEKARRFHRYHPFLGARVLFEGGCPPVWVAAALEHHRGVDGEGFPALEGKSPPHEGSRLVAAANFFDRKRTALLADVEPPERVVRQMRALAGRYFDGKHVDLFLRAVGVFPAGTCVQLTDYRSAIVARAVASDPLRPDVRMLFGEAVDKRVSLLDFDIRERRHVASVLRAVPPPCVMLPPEESALLIVPEYTRAPPDAAPLPPRPTGGPAPARRPAPPAHAPAVAAPASSPPAPRPSRRPREAPSLGPPLTMSPPVPSTKPPAAAPSPSLRPKPKPIPREDPEDE